MHKEIDGAHFKAESKRKDKEKISRKQGKNFSTKTIALLLQCWKILKIQIQRNVFFFTGKWRNIVCYYREKWLLQQDLSVQLWTENSSVQLVGDMNTFPHKICTCDGYISTQEIFLTTLTMIYISYDEIKNNYLLMKLFSCISSHLKWRNKSEPSTSRNTRICNINTYTNTLVYNRHLQHYNVVRWPTSLNSQKMFRAYLHQIIYFILIDALLTREKIKRTSSHLTKVTISKDKTLSVFWEDKEGWQNRKTGGVWILSMEGAYLSY